MRIFLYYIGKSRDANANGMADEYLKRSRRYTKCEMREIQPARFDPWAKHPAASKILLDPVGKSLTTARFVELIAKAEMEGRDLVFVVGGAEGLPEEWKAREGLHLSLSPMTFPHELARAMLAEQVYRAFTTLRGHPYPR